MTDIPRRSECPYHPRPTYREYHHIGADFVTVHWDDSFGGWLTTYGHLNHRGKMTTVATPEEVAYQIDLMQRNATANATYDAESHGEDEQALTPRI